MGMGGGSASAALYRDVALVGVAVFVAVTLFVSALSDPASAQTRSLPADSLLAATTDAPAMDATAAVGTSDAGTVEHRNGGIVTSPTADAPHAHGPATVATTVRPHGTVGGAGHSHGTMATTPPPAGHAPAGNHQQADATSSGHDDHDASGDARGDHGDAHGDHGDMEGDHGEQAGSDAHHAHAAGCADDHPGTLALVAASRRSAERMNVATMIAEGYIPYFDAMVPGNAATEGVGHWLNPKYIDDGVMLDPTQPESVLTDEFHNPMGLMFIQDAGVKPPPVYVNDDGSVCSPWHPHTDMPARFSWWFYRQVYDGAAYKEGDATIPEETPSMMHLWFVDNPAGTYAAHDYPPASSRERLGPRLPIPGGQPPATPADGVLPDPADGPVGPGHTCPHCP